MRAQHAPPPLVSPDLERGQLLVAERRIPEAHPHAVHRGGVGRQRKDIEHRRAQPVEALGPGRAPRPVLRALHRDVEGMLDQLVLAREVMREQARGRTHLRGHGTQGQAAETLGGQHTPDGLGHVPPPFLVIATRRHTGYST
jgi:hypothetical protein